MTDKPAYFSILTAAVRYDKSLCANAKLLYSEITALTQKEGYCWASNKHFSDLYEVDVSTVKRWISDLEKGGHLEIHTEKKGMGWDRKIYARNVYEGSKRSLPKAQKEALRGLENEPIITQDSNNKENNNRPPAVAAQAVVVFPFLEEGKNGKEELKKIQTYDVQTSHPPRSNVTPPTFKRHTYTETSPETSSEKNNNRPPAVAAQAVVVFPFLDDLLKAISGLPISNADARDIAADYKHLPRKEALSIIEAYVAYVRNSKRPIDSYAATLRTAFLKKWTAKEDRSKKLKEQFDREQEVCDSNREICDIVKAKTRQIQGLTLRPSEKYLEIQLSCWPEAQKIYFSDKSFREQLDSVLRKVHSSLNALLNPC